MNMFVSEEYLGNNADDIWHRHEPEIRLLYQTKSLNEVKRMMDAKPGFPRMAFKEDHILKFVDSIKTWHEKLGTHGIRKTIKNEEWSKVYRYCAHYRLEDPSRKRGDKTLKRTKRRTEVIFGNRTFTWDQAWKNMKRAGAIVEPQLDPPSPLPLGITVRTPPPVLSSPSPHMSSNTLRPRDEFTTTIKSQRSFPPSESGNTYLYGGSMCIQQSRLLEASPNNALPSNCSQLSEWIKAQMMLHLPGLPIWGFSNTLVEMADIGLPSQESACEKWYGATASLTPHTISPIENIMFPETGISNESVFYLSDMFSFLTIRQPSADLVTFDARNRAYITVSMAVYLLSNNLVNPTFGIWSGQRDFFETLDSVFAEIPARHLRALLQTRLASVRAAFEAMLNICGVLKQRFAFKSLVDIGICNSWLSISVRGHHYLYHAICMDLDEVVQWLLESGCRPDIPLMCGDFTYAKTSLVEAFRRRNIQCVQLLLKHCDVNSQVQFGHDFFMTSFTFFLQKTCHLDEMLFGQGIKLYLDVGADINSLLKQDIFKYSVDAPRRRWWQHSRIWSVLDYLFCFHPRLFYDIAQEWSPEQASQPTRAGILMSLESGPSALDEYCKRLAQDVGRACLYEYLELLVAEQLTGISPCIRGPRGVVDLKIVCALVDFGVSMGKVLSRVPCLLGGYMEVRREESDGDCDMEVIRFLLDNRASVDDRALREAVRWQNTGLLTLLIQNTTDIRQQGAEAVVEAAIANDLEAVKMLLDAGVDVNTDLEPGQFALSQEESASLLFRVVEEWTLPFEDLSNMIDFLVQRGAHFRVSAMKPLLSDLMERVLKTSSIVGDLRRKIVQYIIDAGCDLSNPDVPSAKLLETCGFFGNFGHDNLERVEIFESMFRNGALLQPGAPLAAWIVIGGRAELAYEMLCGGIDIDAYFHNGKRATTALQAAADRCSEELVVLLLQKGADVNAPARGYCGKTALQAICKYVPQSPAEKQQQLSIINLLLTHGAKINAAPARRFGGTALQSAAKSGNLEVTMLLLSCDPPVDVNAPPCQVPHLQFPYSNALDLAARHGRMDVVKLLLNNDALSSWPGDTGYDGAIQAAENAGWLAIADLIRQHATTIFTSNTTLTNLSQPQRDWHEYVYDEYSDGYTTFIEDSDEDYEDEESDKNSDSTESREKQDSMAQVQIRPDAVEYPGHEHEAGEPGWILDMETNDSLNFNISFGNLADDMGSIYGLDDTAPTSHIEIAASAWGLGQ